MSQPSDIFPCVLLHFEWATKVQTHEHSNIFFSRSHFDGQSDGCAAKHSDLLSTCNLVILSKCVYSISAFSAGRILAPKAHLACTSSELGRVSSCVTSAGETKLRVDQKNIIAKSIVSSAYCCLRNDESLLAAPRNCSVRFVLSNECAPIIYSICARVLCKSGVKYRFGRTFKRK